ncbi:unnamed protein product [Rotaria sp. Silwood2]|nr:unnamed protein product [Rotaria sp. Silwood2]CAF4318369.1 unnamed protein product [Rotaria sp. Silwood2]
MEYNKNLIEISPEGFEKGSIQEFLIQLLQHHDSTEDEFIQFLKDHINYMDINENLSELLHSIFNNLSINSSLIDVNSQMEHNHGMIDDNDDDAYVDYLVDDLNIGENFIDIED